MEQKKSRMLRLTLMGGQARVFICDKTELAQQARDIHNASNTCSAAMGRMLAATAIMGANLKSEGDRITATINGGGPAGPICAIAGPDGTVKVTIEHPEVELPLKENGKLNVGGALGKDGQLTVMRSFGFGEPYVGRVALVSGEIAEDFAMYYLESEQTPSLCALGTLVGENIISSGGILIQAMPDCSEELLDALEIRAELFSSISQLLSEMTLEKFIAAGFIHEFDDIFHLDRHRDAIVTMEGFGEKSYENLIQAAKTASHTTLPRLIFGLGIAGIGLANAKVICRHFDFDLNAMRGADAEELCSIDGIGGVLADAWVKYFKNDKNNEILDHLLADLTFENEVRNEEQTLAGKTFVITGSVEHFANRKELQEKIESLGGKAAGSVSAKTSYLINNDVTSNSSKNKKARELGIPILSEEDFLKMIGEEKNAD